MLNAISIMGRFTKDPELRKTQSGVSVASFTIAVDRDFVSKDTGKRECDFIECIAWSGTADFVQKYFHKGSAAVVNGRIQTRSWEDSEGKKRKAVEVNVSNIYFGSSSKDNQKPAETGTPVQQTFIDLTNEDDEALPF